VAAAIRHKRVSHLWIPCLIIEAFEAIVLPYIFDESFVIMLIYCKGDFHLAAKADSKRVIW
jgi:hypothetical protein